MKKLNHWISYTLIILSLVSCHSQQEQKQSKKPLLGVWRMEMNLGEKQLPFNFTLDLISSKYEMIISNADEKIAVNDIIQKDDSLFIKLPIFESEFKLEIIDSTHLVGEWINYYKSDDYKIPVQAEYGNSYRFSQKQVDFTQDIAATYEVVFEEKSGETFPAIGILKQSGKQVSGTFATETGDYRHLAGEVIDDSIYLSTFDGSHAFLFEAAIKDSLIEGTFWSGNHYQANWKAKRNPDASLRNPDSLTFLKEGYDSFDFSFPDVNGNLVSFSDEKFQNQVSIIQIMGSWCPNCLDETRYLTELHEKYKQSGLQIVALAFERTRSEAQALKNLEALKARTSASYPFLLAAWNRETKAAEILPMLNHVMSFPTAIFIDKKGKVRKIHTGFYGPGTGEYYNKFTSETEAFVKQLLDE